MATAPSSSLRWLLLPSAAAGGAGGSLAMTICRRSTRALLRHWNA
eukprot:CAMPEP_0119567504 /NCGR_PEP_ID=MMETSP1352-20130426/36099_1 /TAXON_ID=265584 /ORGANISM="Stauroneis constricta, Strain CCMP1120" /LENGTH=44 /DNA_ID= /DNA_START= /DNA_END= /DNA_ORIENTATION=